MKDVAVCGKINHLDDRLVVGHDGGITNAVVSVMKIRNDDGILHNIHTFSIRNKPFNIAQPKVLREIERAFAVPERIPVRCDVHGWMSSWVIVVDHPYNAVTDQEGRFEISGIPPGRYTGVCWQEELGEQSAEIIVGPNDNGAAHDFLYKIADRASPRRMDVAQPLRFEFESVRYRWLSSCRHRRWIEITPR
ncbi:MAG TPA: carboxypeptidase regulatory-like domain-containing protein [Bacteroidota bacterium]|nr:carboxypeptidase regulatory-like domain-containing protein [Bacteroidota bacterium]